MEKREGRAERETREREGRGSTAQVYGGREGGGRPLMRKEAERTLLTHLLRKTEMPGTRSLRALLIFF